MGGQDNVLVGDITAPDTTAKTGGHGHTVGKGARVGKRLRLSNHDAAYLDSNNEFIDVLLMGGIDPAGVSLSRVIENTFYQLQSILEPAQQELDRVLDRHEAFVNNERDSERIVNPGPGETLHEDDLLLLLGQDDQLPKAKAELTP